MPFSQAKKIHPALGSEAGWKGLAELSEKRSIRGYLLLVIRY
jgi:hypothetical protein